MKVVFENVFCFDKEYGWLSDAQKQENIPKENGKKELSGFLY
ncbi:hypothetical protein [Coprobacter fastidiosus]|nr:hypothetical protein [Coprobacter fastidiosus]